MDFFAYRPPSPTPQTFHLKMAEDDGFRLCLICTAKSDSAHFGVDSCRACAAFFRRTVKMNKRYICRQSTQRCDVSKDVRFVCRSCRYKRCLEIGMDPKVVLSKPERTSNSVPSPDSRPRALNRSPDDSVFSHPSTSSNSDSPAVVSTTPLLDTIQQQYNILSDVCTSTDLSVVAQEGRQLNEDGRLPGTIAMQNKYSRASHDWYLNFARMTFPEMSMFDDSERWMVNSNFITSLFLFDGVLRARQHYPNNHKIFMVSYLAYIDTDNMEFYLSDIPPHIKVNLEDATKLMREMTRKVREVWLGPLLDRAELNPIEAIAIYGLLMWPTYQVKATTRVREVSYKYHLQIFAELQAFYRERLGIIDYSSRIAYITSILLSVQNAVQRLQEDMVIYQLLNAYDSKDFVCKIVSG